LEPKEEEIPLLSQPPPKDDGDPSLIPKEEPQMTKELSFSNTKGIKPFSSRKLKISCTQFLLLSWESEVYFTFVYPKGDESYCSTHIFIML
jgi:hypothetical protein